MSEATSQERTPPTSLAARAAGAVAIRRERAHLLLALERALRARGLRTQLTAGGTALTAVNPATVTRDFRGLRQTVACRPDADGVMTLWWVWSGTSRGSYELELLGPAEDVERAATRIAAVIAPA